VVVQLPGADGRDKRVDQGRELLLRADDDAGLTLLELDGLGTELYGHDDLTGGVGLPPGPDGLLLGGGLPLAVDLDVRTKVAATGNRFAGKWNEVTRDTIGNISGSITPAGIRGKIDGIGFTADLAIAIQANRQSVTIDPEGATDISQVAITLTRI